MIPTEPIKVGDYEIVIRKIKKESTPIHDMELALLDAHRRAHRLIQNIFDQRRFTAKNEMRIMEHHDEVQKYKRGGSDPLTLLSQLDPEGFKTFKLAHPLIFPPVRKTRKVNKAAAARRRKLARKATPAKAGFPRLFRP